MKSWTCEASLSSVCVYVCSSLVYVDLRLCFPIGNVTRLQYELDTSFFNGYYKMLTKAPPLHPQEVNASKNKKKTDPTNTELAVSTSMGQKYGG